MGYSGVIVFGDSLVDPGNALGLANWYGSLPFTEDVDAAPAAAKGYYAGRFTNGFTFADLISNKYIGVATKPVFPYEYKDPYLGVRIAPFASDPTGNNLNFAYGGAQMRRGDEKVPDIDGQTDAWRDAVDGDADPNALHLFAFGANDVHDLVPKTGAWASLATATATLTKAADKFIHEILQTIEDGVNHVLVIGVPDIGIQPYYNGLTDEAARRAVATQYSALLDSMTQSRVAALQLPADVEFRYVSFTQMAAQVIDKIDDLYPASQIYPLNQSTVVFFDKAHPTAQVNALGAAYLLDQLNGTVSGDKLPLNAPDYSLNAAISVKGEVDSVVLSLAANTTYTLNMLGLSSLGGNYSVLADSTLKVLGPTGAVIGSNDDGGVGLDASLTFTTTSAGDYVLQLAGVGSMTGTYKLQADGTAAANTNYFVTHSSAVILERAGEGTDTVFSSVSYVLQPEASIELLRTASDGGTPSINLTGNGLAQTIVGNAGNNIIEGKSGADSLWGLAGNDKFAFSTPLGPANVDRIYDFNAVDDTILLEDTIFYGLSVGALTVGAFVAGASAQQADDRVIYDPLTGSLYFDPDGAGGVAQIQFATLSSSLTISAADFVVV
ncbi:SGNH/GDSL hydrolase family protein [Sphingomonas sp. SM33]|uniref:SGNH/GDSL hydrolase family protein n=1 Tax=Sphingomonas telluris TaxID=2907998 RepID=A0ABS9VJ17_9SPHN|nr:SGNH/GDSL hydrolase family protein [Sphingomonas telluris]MCH8614981.1 SGNH/GDSL hydrolase family protein [Sphingomonas telluris]